jgi:dihydroorotate dehydrogenase
LAFEAFTQTVQIGGLTCVLRNDAAAAVASFRKGSTQSPQMQRCALRLDRAAASVNVDLLLYHVPGLTLVSEGIECASRAGVDFWAGVNVDSILGPAVSDKLWQLVNRAAIDAGWGGAVWKTLGNPIVNVSSRFGGVDFAGRRIMGFNNIELITDRPLEVNLREIAEVKKRYPKHAVIVSLMVESKEEWREIIRRSEDTGCDGLELNFGCPHGMCERGMGSAVGQEPKVLTEITSWVKEYARTPVLVKLTPNIGDILEPGYAALDGNCDGLSLINTIKSIVGVDLDRMVPLPRVGGGSTNGGYCGPAVKPIALHMVAALAREKALAFGSGPSMSSAHIL